MSKIDPGNYAVQVYVIGAPAFGQHTDSCRDCGPRVRATFAVEFGADELVYVCRKHLSRAVEQSRKNK